MRINDTAHLCGYFSNRSSEAFDPMALQHDFWNPVQYTQKELHDAKNFYYPEFAEFMMNEVNIYTHQYARDLKIKFRDGRDHAIYLDELRLYCFPFGVVMYSIKIVQNDVPMQDALDALFMLRNLPFMQRQSMEEYMSLVIDPLTELDRKAGNSGDVCSLIECGNKQKLFHSVLLREKPKDSQEFDHLLYGAGTLGMYKEDDPKGFSKEYYASIMSSSRLSVFNSWQAMSLLDIFTIVAHDVPEYMLSVWDKDYFGMMYVYTLFKKFFLFRINSDFRSDEKNFLSVRKNLATFEKSYEFPRIVYNFLPELLLNSMEKGIDVPDEKQKLAEIINKENQRRETETGDKMNLFLGMITCLTLFSAIWDFACLMDGVFEFSANIGTVTGVRACTMALISLVCILLLVVRRKK